jgi:hypothetical protein
MAPLVLLAAMVTRVGWADTYTVTKSADSGPGSLRWAINQANKHAGADKIVFAKALKGQMIQPATVLPTITGAYTSINGDIDGNGAPDIEINGINVQTDDSGLTVNASHCSVTGLAVTQFQSMGVVLWYASYGTVRSCHLGASLSGTQPKPNLEGGLALAWCDHCVIGGASAPRRNVICCLTSDPTCAGIMAADSSDCTIIGNYLNLRRDGVGALGIGTMGIAARSLFGNVMNNHIGGSAPGQGNIFASVETGLYLLGANITDNTVAGNLFGLAADGTTPLTITEADIAIEGAVRNVIGGTTAGSRNVFAGGAKLGIRIIGVGAVGNKIQGNYFGTNAKGTARRPLTAGIEIADQAGAQTVGGSEVARNWFCLEGANAYAVKCNLAGGGTVVSKNRFGVFPAGGNVPGSYRWGVIVTGVSGRVVGNVFAHAGVGLDCLTDSDVKAYGNTFRDCGNAVYLFNNAKCHLGDLGNASSRDDGGNIFSPSNMWTIYNTTPDLIKAEGNNFLTTDGATIDAKIIDVKDVVLYGLVDYDPLAGGVHPTGEGPAALALAGVSAMPTGAGAEVVFQVSAPAEATVTILNMAGRVVATPARVVPVGAGTRRVVWNRQTTTGVRAPAGAYLVRIVTMDAQGQRATALCALRLQ